MGIICANRIAGWRATSDRQASAGRRKDATCDLLLRRVCRVCVAMRVPPRLRSSQTPLPNRKLEAASAQRYLEVVSE